MSGIGAQGVPCYQRGEPKSVVPPWSKTNSSSSFRDRSSLGWSSGCLWVSCRASRGPRKSRQPTRVFLKWPPAHYSWNATLWRAFLKTWKKWRKSDVFPGLHSRKHEKTHFSSFLSSNSTRSEKALKQH